MKFKKRHIKLKPNHQWKTPTGYQLIVIDRGAVHICFPRGWLARPSDRGSMKLHDAEPPDDSCRMEISYLRVNPQVAAVFPFEQAVRTMVKTKNDLDHLDQQEPVYLRRDGLRLAWVQSKYSDPDNGRLVCSRSLMAHGNNIHVIITYDCWADQVEQFEPVWNTLLKTLRLGEFVADPSTGRIHHPNLN